MGNSVVFHKLALVRYRTAGKEEFRLDDHREIVWRRMLRMQAQKALENAGHKHQMAANGDWNDQKMILSTISLSSQPDHFFLNLSLKLFSTVSSMCGRAQ